MPNPMFSAGGDFDIRGQCNDLNDGDRASGVYEVPYGASNYPAGVSQDVYAVASLETIKRTLEQGLRVQFERFYYVSQLTAITSVLTRWNYYAFGAWQYGAWTSETGAYESPSFQSGWRGDSGYGCFGKIRKVYNAVSVEFGHIETDSAPGTTTVFTLPTGYRPVSARKVPCVVLDSGYHPGWLEIETGGAVKLWYTPGYGVRLYANFSFATV